MTVSSKYLTQLRHPFLWAIFILYIVIAGFTIVHHEMWGDEMHSWNIAKGSAGYGELIHNIRYEGHPPLWHSILWIISKCTHNLSYVQAVHMVIAVISVFLILFFSPFPLVVKTLLPFGYYFLYEYSVLSRNYAIAVLLALLICFIMRKDFAGRLLLYYLLLFLLTNTHMLAIPLAASLHLYFLFRNGELGKKRHFLLLHIISGLIIALPSFYFILPPSDSQINMQFWLEKWTPQQLVLFAKSPVWAFLPIPAWWKYNFWNTQFLVSANDNIVIKLITPIIAVFILAGIWFVLKKSKKCLLLFAASFLLTAIIAVTTFSLSSTRYVGFIYISFVAAWWLYNEETTVSVTRQRMINVLLLFQLLAGVYAVIQDIRFPFSNAYRVKELLQEVPPAEKMVTDYWALNTVSAYADESLYCIDIKREGSFISWGPDLAAINTDPDRYYNGIHTFFEKEKVNKVYMVSTVWPEKLMEVAPKLWRQYKVALLDKREGAIDKGGNLYLYLIKEKITQ